MIQLRRSKDLTYGVGLRGSASIHEEDPGLPR